MGKVTKGRVVGSEVDVPASVDGVEFWCPYIATVFGIWGRAPDYVFGSSFLKVKKCIRGPDFDAIAICSESLEV